jgi:hypothetical protein
MSRCGSTLTAQMLAAAPETIVVSEAQPIDQMLQIAMRNPEVGAGLFANMIAGLCQVRDDRHRRAVIKLDSWHTLALPFFRYVFPDVPWAFLYREPAEVLASQVLQRGIQTVPEYLPPALFGLTPDDAVDSEAYCARVLARTCKAVLQPLADGGGIAVNYRELPDALFTRIAPHFGLEISAEARAAMRTVAARDAKRPSLPFDASQPAKSDVMTPALRAIAEEHMGVIYREIEARNAAMKG